MMKTSSTFPPLGASAVRPLLAFCTVLFLASGAAARVLDDFNDNTKTGWTDFTFVSGFGLPKEAQGQFRFELAPVTQAIFTAGRKASETFELKEGRTIEFRVDIVDSGGKDSFAVLSFIPSANSPLTLAGYGFAKSTTDILITKGINRYFVNDPTHLKQTNITLVLSMSVRSGNVHITGRALDRDAQNAVIWERTVVDTPAADVMATGSDSPQAPFITSGYFTLYCYADYDRNAPENPYFVYYDNAEVFVNDAVTIDDFNDNTKTDWTDFTFVTGFGLPKEQSGQFRFELSPVTQAIFTAGRKTARTFELADGERLEFAVDIVESGGKDSFAVLGFMPAANSPLTLSGYGLAKSTTDVLLTKGINRYFVNHAIALKQNNSRLVLQLERRGADVHITGKVLDLDANGAVIWQRSAVDTPAADVMANGTDSPAAPFVTAAYYTLFCYADYDRNAPENPYFVYYDNATALAPPLPENTAPLMAEVVPADYANFLPASTALSFKVTDDKPLVTGKMTITLNGQAPSQTVAFTKLDADGKVYRAELAGALAPNVNYAAVLRVEDADGASVSRTVYFDTFAADSFVIENEDYNFGGGQFITNPQPAVEGSGPAANTYSLQAGIVDIDFTDNRTTPNFQNTMYRQDDPVRMQRSRDFSRAKYAAAGGAEAMVYDYDLGDIRAGEWLNYTRTFPDGTYEVYLRQALVNMDNAESVLEEVTGDRSQPNQSTRVLGSFLGTKTGFLYRNFPLTDGAGQNKIVLRLSGTKTLRLRQVTADAADGARYQNYLILIPTAAGGVQRATLSSLAPAPDSVVASVRPAIRVVVQNRETSIKPGTLRLELNGQAVSGRLVEDANGAVLDYDISPLPPPGQRNTAKVRFVDSQDAELSSEWSFVVQYNQLNAANRRTGAGIDRGFNLRMIQAPPGSGLGNELARAETQLAPNSTIPSIVDTNEVVQVVNMAQDERVSGYFDGETLVPGLDPFANGTDDFAVEIKGWLELTAGIHRFRIVTDDGYKLSSGRTPEDKEPVLAFRSGGTANETVDFVVTQAGLYPFRFVWYERGGNAYAEWSSEDFTNPDSRILINDPNHAAAIKAFRQAPVPVANVLVESSASVTGPFGADASAVINAGALRITIPRSGDRRFYRLRVEGAGSATIHSVRLSGADIELTYALQ